MTEQERQEFVAGPHVAVLSVASDGSRPPHATPVWYAYERGGDVTFFTGTQGRRSRKAELIGRAGSASLTVQREDFPYAYVTVEGTVVGEERPPSAERALAIAGRTAGSPSTSPPRRGRRRCAPERGDRDGI
jgi:nitroimidazol reductase NimA-like FMN-containing flavoprotein (pyridoxamine 5'-phosphate oxidase superfamily)